MSKLRVHPEVAARIAVWATTANTGISSETMAAIALGAEKERKNHWGSNLDAPHDASDFGRCYRLVLAVPEIIDVFDVIAKKVPEFAGILKHWDELCLLYERERKSGLRCGLYDQIKVLRQVKGKK